jgi:hypothetical protein
MLKALDPQGIPAREPDHIYKLMTTWPYNS